METKHYMVDIETMGTLHNSAIVSIGAVEFDPFDEVLTEHTFYEKIDLDDCIKHGMTVTAATIKWWMQQSDDARSELTGRDQKGLEITMDLFNNYLQGHSMNMPDLRIWSHGVSFDAVLLESAYRACDRKVPWKYDGVRCTRTIFDAAGVTLHSLTRDGTHHNGLLDAQHQARVVQLAYRRLDLRGVANPIPRNPDNFEGTLPIPDCHRSGVIIAQPFTWGDSHSDSAGWNLEDEQCSTK